MRNFFGNKISIFLVIAFVFWSFVFPAYSFADEIDTYIHQTNFENHSCVSVYALDANSGEVLYKKNEQKLLNPASILKVLTFGASYVTLGKDYRFETALYKDKSNNIYVKLGGDPLLAQEDLIKLFSQIKNHKINSIYIDDTIFDKTPYPSGWMEEDTFPAQRAISPYIIDDNTFEVTIKRSSLAAKIDIIQNGPYQIPIINELKPSDKQDWKIQKLYGENSSIIGFSGSIAKDETIVLPVLSSEINFKIKLIQALEKAQIKHFKKIPSRAMPQDVVKLTSISHSIFDVSKKILKNSDNFSSEVVFKTAAAKFVQYNHPATLADAIEMFKSVFSEDTDDIKITDGSGVSRNNLVSAEFVAQAFRKLFEDEDFKNLLATANEGTLSDRMNFLEGNLRAKTGTLSNMSSIAGSLTSKEGRNIVFAIIVQNSPKRKAVLKNFENNVITALYRKY